MKGFSDSKLPNPLDMQNERNLPGSSKGELGNGEDESSNNGAKILTKAISIAIVRWVVV